MCTYTSRKTYSIYGHASNSASSQKSENIGIKRGVRQGDTISPKMFTTTLESTFRRLNWENEGEAIDGAFLTNLRFADDIFLCTETPQ